MENFEACWDDSNWYFLVKHLFCILSPSILPKGKFKKKKKNLSTFKPFSLINSFAIQDTQGETEMMQERIARMNEGLKKHALYRKFRQAESIQLNKETAKGSRDQS